MASADNKTNSWQPFADNSAALLGRYVPFESLVNEHDVLTRGGDLIRTWRLDALRRDGTQDASFEPVERHATFRMLLRRLSGGRFMLWTHRVRRRGAGRAGRGSLELAEAARNREEQPLPKQGVLSGHPCGEPGLPHDSLGDSLRDEVYLTLLVRSVPRRSPRFLRIPKKANRAASGCPVELLSCMQDTAHMVSAMLAQLQPHLLGEYCIGGRSYNEMLDFLGLLVNGSWARQRLSPALLYRSLPRAHVVFNGEKIALRQGSHTQHAIAFGMADSRQSQPYRAHDLRLPQHCEFIETQSFSPAFERAMEGGDDLQGCVLERQQALGDYHYSLVLFGDEAEETEHRAAAAAYVIGATSGIAVAVCDMSDAAWFSQWPGTWSWRARQARLSSRVLDAASQCLDARLQVAPDS